MHALKSNFKKLSLNLIMMFNYRNLLFILFKNGTCDHLFSKAFNWKTS